jgi:hypothetical protein
VRSDLGEIRDFLTKNLTDLLGLTSRSHKIYGNFRPFFVTPDQHISKVEQSKGRMEQPSFRLLYEPKFKMLLSVYLWENTLFKFGLSVVRLHAFNTF